MKTLEILWRIHLHNFQLHFPFLMHNVNQSYCMITEMLHFTMSHHGYDYEWNDMLYECTVIEMLHEWNIKLQMSLQKCYSAFINV